MGERNGHVVDFFGHSTCFSDLSAQSVPLRTLPVSCSIICSRIAPLSTGGPRTLTDVRRRHPVRHDECDWRRRATKRRQRPLVSYDGVSAVPTNRAVRTEQTQAHVRFYGVARRDALQRVRVAITARDAGRVLPSRRVFVTTQNIFNLAKVVVGIDVVASGKFG